VTIIARFLGIEPSLSIESLGQSGLDQAAIEIMNFSKVEVGRLCWIYPGDWLLLLPNVDQTTLLYGANLYWISSDTKVVQPINPPPPPHSSQAGPSSSSQPPPTDYADLQATLRSIQEEQVSFRAYVASENTVLRDFVQERHDELHGMLATPTQYF